MRAEIVSVGTELLLGQIVDTNAAYLAQHLSALGIDLYWVSQVGDNQGRLVEVLRRAWGRSDLIVITGGLGPTEDDLTREGIAEMLGERMVVVPELEAELRRFFSRRGLTMPDRNVKQATLIPAARPLLNPVGTAPGWFVERDGRLIVAMPGVPSEMRLMWESKVLPYLREKQGGAVILTKNLKVIGVGESAVEEIIRHLLAATNPTIATYAKADGVHVRISAKAQGVEAAQQLIARMEATVRPLLGNAIYGADDETLEGAVLDLLQTKRLGLASVEELTGGLLAATLTAADVGRGHYRGGLVSPSPAAKAAWRLLPKNSAADGVATAEMAVGMAQLARQELDAEVGLAAAGVGVPLPGEAQPAGTYFVAVDDRGQTEVVSSIRRTTLPELRRFVVLQALALVRKRLLED